MTETERRENGTTTRYVETDDERLLVVERNGRTAVLAQNREGYAMVAIRPGVDEPELERYYGFDVALDHAGELLGVSPHDIPIPEAAVDMGM